MYTSPHRPRRCNPSPPRLPFRPLAALRPAMGAATTLVLLAAWGGASVCPAFADPPAPFGFKVDITYLPDQFYFAQFSLSDGGLINGGTPPGTPTMLNTASISSLTTDGGGWQTGTGNLYTGGKVDVKADGFTLANGDAGGVAYLAQKFRAGNSGVGGLGGLHFASLVSMVPAIGVVPDQFSFNLLDTNFDPVISNGQGSGTLLTVDIGSGMTLYGNPNPNAGPQVKVTLSGANTLVGGLTIYGGSVVLDTADATSGNVLMTNTVSLYANNGLVTNGFSAVSLGGLNGSGDLALGTTALTVGYNNADTDYSGALTGTAGLTKIGQGTLTLGGSNTMLTGGLTLTNGAVAYFAETSLGAASSPITFNGGLLRYTGATTTFGTGHTLTTTVGSGGAVGGFDVASAGTTLTVGQAISGAGGLTKAGAGTLTLGGINTYTGATNVQAGTLRVGGGQKSLGNQSAVSVFAGATLDLNNTSVIIGSLAGTGAVSNVRALTVGGDNTNTTFAGSLTPVTPSSGTLTKVGTGTLTLSGTNMLGGNLTVSGGVVNFGAASALPVGVGKVIVQSGGVVTAGYGVDQTFLSAVNTTSKGVVALTADNANALSFAALTDVRLGAIGNATYSGSLTPGGKGYVLGGGGGTLTLTTALTGARDLNVDVSGTLPGTLILLAENTYTGRTLVGGSAANVGQTLRVYSDDTINGLKGGLGAVPVTADAHNITLQNGGILQIDARVPSPAPTPTPGTAPTPAPPINLAANRGITLGNGGGVIDTYANDVLYGGVINGSGAFTKTGNGTLTLSAYQTYTGTTTVNQGTLLLNAPPQISGNYGATLSASSPGLFINAGGTVQLGQAFQIPLTLPVTLGNRSGLNVATLDLGSNENYLRTVTLGDGAQVKGAGGYLVMSGAASSFLVGAGNTALVSVDVGIDSGLTYNIGAGGSLAQTGTVTGMPITKTGTGTLTLSGANNFSGTTISAGTLAFTGALVSVNGNPTNTDANLGGSSASFPGSVNLAGGATLSYIGNGSVSFAPARQLILNGAANNPATVNVSAPAISLVIPGVVSGTGGFIKTGAGNLTLYGANTFTGDVTLRGGILNIGGNTNGDNLGSTANTVFFDGGALGTSNIGDGSLVDPARTLTAINGHDYLFNVTSANGVQAIKNVLSGTAAVRLSGPGEYALLGNNTYAGGTYLDSGILFTTADSNLGAAPAIATPNLFFNGGTLRYGSVGFALNPNRTIVLNAGGGTIDSYANTVAIASQITGVGALTKVGSGVLTLTGANTYSGGTVVSGGVLSISADSQLGAVPVTAATNVTLTTLASQTYDPQTDGSGTLRFGSDFAVNPNRVFSVSGNAVIDTNGYNVSVGSLNGASTANLIKIGNRTLTITHDSTLPGTFNVNGGTVYFGDSSAPSTSTAGSIIGGTTNTNGGTSTSTNVNVAYTNDPSGYAFLGLRKATTVSGNVNFDVSNAGLGLYDNARGGDASFYASNGGYIYVENNAVVGSGQLLPSIGSGANSVVGFYDTASAGNAFVFAGGTNSHVYFTGNSSAGHGLLAAYPGGTIDLSGLTSTGMTAAGLVSNPDTIDDNGNLTLGGGTLNLGTKTLTLIGSDPNSAYVSYAHEFAGIIQGTGGLVLTNGVTQTLSGNNTFSGGITINDGTLITTKDGNLGAPGAPITIGASGGTLRLDGSFTLGNARVLTLNGKATIDTGNSQRFTYLGNITGAGSLNVIGYSSILPSTLVLTGTNTYTGGTTVSNTKLILENDGYNQSNNIIGSGNVVLNSGSSLLFNYNNTFTFPGVISGVGNVGFVANQFNSTVTLTGANTYSGTTSVTSGYTLKVAGNTAHLGSGMTTVDNATLSFENGASAGNGIYTVARAGSNILFNDQTSAGTATIVNNGTVTFVKGAATAGMANITNNAILNFNASTTAGSSTITNKTGGTVNFNLGSAAGDALSTLTNQSGGSVNFLGASAGSGVITNDSGGILYFAQSNVNPTADLASIVNNGSMTIYISGGADLHVSVGSLSGSGTVNFNRSLVVGGLNKSDTFSGVLSGGSLTKTGTGTLTLTGANTYSDGTTISGGTLLVSSLAAVNNTLPTLIGGQFGLSVTGTLSDRYTLYAAGSGFASAAGTTTTISGVVSGTNGATIGNPNGATGTVVLTGANTYTGGTTIAGGTLLVPSLAAVNNTLPTINGGQFGLSVTGTLSNNFALGAAGSGFASAPGTTTTLSGVVSGTNGATIGNPNSATGTVVLTNANTYGGTTTINAGTLSIGAGGTTGSVASSSIVNNAALVFNRSNAVTYGGVISGTGTLTQSGAGTLTLTGANPYSGTTTINAGTLTLGNSLALQNSPLVYNTGGGTLSFGTLTSATLGGLSGTKGIALANATPAAVALTVGSSTNASSTYDGVLSGAGSLTKAGGGTLTLTGANTYSGGTTISGGELSIGADGNVSSGTVTLNGGLLQWTGASETFGRTVTLGSAAFGSGFDVSTAATNLTVASVLTGTGSLTKTGGGALTLTGANPYSGTTTISAGTLNVGVIGGAGTTARLGTGAVTNGSGASLHFYAGSSAGFNAITNNGILSFHDTSTEGNGTITNNNTLSFLNTSTADTAAVINNSGGILDVSGLTSSGISIGSLSGGGNVTLGSKTLTVDGLGSTTTISGSISGTGGSLIKAGGGNLTLTGANTYSGTTTTSGGQLAVGVSGGAGTTARLGTGTVTIGGGTGLTFYAASSAGAGTLTNNGGLSFQDTSTAGTRTITNNSDQSFYTGSSAGTSTITNNHNLNFHQSASAGNSTLINNNGGLLQFFDTSTADTAAVINNSGATLDISGLTSLGISVGALSGAGNVTLGSKTLTVGGLGIDTTISGIISGTGSLIKTGTGDDLTLTGANTYTGTTTLSAGQLYVSGSLGAGPVFVTGSGFNYPYLHYTGSAVARNVLHTASGTGNIGFSNSARAGSATFTVDSTSGLVFGDQSHADTATITNNGEVYFLSRGTTAANDPSPDSVRITNNGKLGLLTLASAANATVVNGTTASVEFENGNGVARPVALGSLSGGGTVNIGANSLTLGNLNGTDVFSGVISGSGSLTKTGTGTLALTGDNLYSGTTTVSGGTLRVGPVSTAVGAYPASLASSAVTVGAGATLIGNGSFGATSTIRGILVGSAPVTVRGTGARLQGNGFYGAMTLGTGGTIAPGNSVGQINATSLLIEGGTNFEFDLGLGTKSDTIALSGALTFSSSVGGNVTFFFDVSDPSMTLGNIYTVATFGSTNLTQNDVQTRFVAAPRGKVSGISGDWKLTSNGLTFMPTSFVNMPEPGTLALLLPCGAAGLTMLGVSQRRRRQPAGQKRRV